MVVWHRLGIDACDSLSCSNRLLRALHHGPGLVLQAAQPWDTVHGSLTINHVPGDHLIRVEVYEHFEAPTRQHQSTLDRPLVVPSEAEIHSRLNLAVMAERSADLWEVRIDG